MRYMLTMESRNQKTGPIPVSTSSKDTCPDVCPLKESGCYAKYGALNIHWDRLSNSNYGLSWNDFCDKVSTIPQGSIWRHNQAGDLPPKNPTNRKHIISKKMMDRLIIANNGKMGFTYTHHFMGFSQNRDVVRLANNNGFTINLSANNLEHADILMGMNIAPVVVIQDAKEGDRHDTHTPAGHKVVTCPATYMEAVTCQTCKLCARAGRKVIVGFPAHGNAKNKVLQISKGNG